MFSFRSILTCIAQSLLGGVAVAATCFGAENKLPTADPANWNLYGRVKLDKTPEATVISGGYTVTKERLSDGEVSFKARAPKGGEQVQIWVGFRCHDRDRRYALGLRGGSNNDLYLARYAPDGGARFLGLVPLDFKPEPGIWYSLRVAMMGNRFQVFVNDEKLPRLNIEDPDPLWTDGGVALGGGWLPTEFGDLQVRGMDDAMKTAFAAVGNSAWKPTAPDREALRRVQRSAYQPCIVKVLGPDRTEVSLNGGWLFKPAQELKESGVNPQQPTTDDQSWHVMEVPAFWTPSLAWLYGEIGFGKLTGVTDVARQKGQSDNIYKAEMARLDGYTFDWKKTREGWYRHHLQLPSAIAGHRFELCFDAIAKISEIWVNGTKVGSHTGMFGAVQCDITSAVRPGENVIAVRVLQNWDRPQPAKNDVQGVAVTVEITSSMLNSLPHGMYDDRAAGIWQPVKLVVTSPAYVDEVFIQPGLQSATAEIAVANSEATPKRIDVGYTISSKQDGALLCTNDRAAAVMVPASARSNVKITTPIVAPKLWTPADPNLYELELRLSTDGRVIDRLKTPFGFRTFAVEGNRLLLNGKPYWLRGGNHFPSFLQPNDAGFARQFMRLARDGNVRVTRSHGAPMTKAWLDAADEIGMGISYEGTWPWLMLKGEPPDPELLKIWEDEFLSIIQKTRNHPSVLVWTVNNEMKFPIFDKKDTALLKRKWTIITDTVQAIRKTDPTRPVVMDSGYLRKEGDYEKILQPNGYDDGDIDDAHRYYGWYNPTFFHLYKGEFGNSAWPNRPLISQEMSTGYPRTDDGHPTRFYLFQHYTPQSLVGYDAYEHADPAIFLRRQAFMTKELAEVIRRTNRKNSSGILHFAYLTWFKNVADSQTIQPGEGADALRQALQPVLVSAELYGRHFYAGTSARRRVCIANDADDGANLPAGRLLWAVEYEGKVLACGTVATPACAYYENQWIDVDFALPAALPLPRVNARLVLSLEAGGVAVSRNTYDVTLATQSWASLPAALPNVALYGLEGQAKGLLDGTRVETLSTLDGVRPGRPALLIVGDVGRIVENPATVAKLRDFVSAGGKALLLQSGKHLPELFPEQVKGFRAVKGEIVSMHIPESPVFDGIEPLDMAWFERGNGELPYACTGVHQINSLRPDVTALADEFDIHGYLDKPESIVSQSGTPLLRLQLGKGEIINSEMALDASLNDPIAKRLFSNIIRCLLPPTTEK